MPVIPRDRTYHTDEVRYQIEAKRTPLIDQDVRVSSGGRHAIFSAHKAYKLDPPDGAQAGDHQTFPGWWKAADVDMRESLGLVTYAEVQRQRNRSAHHGR